MPVYPGDRPVELVPISQGGISNHVLSCSMHTGTHIDAPGHMIPGGKKLSDYPLSKFFAAGTFIDARGKTSISKELLDNVPLTEDSAVLIYTGFDTLFHTDDYFMHYPPLTDDFAQALVDARVSMVGTDTPSPDYSPFAIHKLLLSNDILILENLTLAELAPYEKNPFEVIALPLKIETDGALARIIARL